MMIAMSRFNLLQHTRDLNEKLFMQGVISKEDYFKHEKHLNAINHLFIINLN